MPNSKESETGTTAKETSLADDFEKVLKLLDSISKKIPDKEKAFDPVTYLVKSIKESDVLLDYKIVAYTKSGEIFNIEGVNNLPRLFDEAMLPEAPGNFEQSFNSCVIRPVLNAFMKYTRDKIEEYRKSAVSIAQSLSLSNHQTTDNNFLTE